MKFHNEFPIIKLNNGLNIMNFSSPHSYAFTTGEILPACHADVAQRYKLDSDHLRHDRGVYSDVLIKYEISDHMFKVLLNATIYNGIDIILVPYPVLDSWSSMVRLESTLQGVSVDEEGEILDISDAERVLLKIRTCKLDDRVTKVIKSNEFCTSIEGLMVINEALVGV